MGVLAQAPGPKCGVAVAITGICFPNRRLAPTCHPPWWFVLGTIDVAERGSAESDRSGRDPWVAGCPFPCICAVRRRDGQSFARRPALSRTPRAQRSLQAKAKHGGSPFDGQNPRALEQHRGPFRPLRLTWTIYFAFVRRVTLVPASLGPPAVRIVLRRLRVPRSGTSPRSYDGPNAWLSGLTLKRGAPRVIVGDSRLRFGA